MKADKVQGLGSALYRQSVKPYKRGYAGSTIVFGLDTEYRVGEDSNRLYTWQLSLNKEHTIIRYDPLDWQKLYDACMGLLKEADIKVKHIRTLCCATFFSTAEAQWLDVANSRIEIFGTHQVNYRCQVTPFRSIYLFDVSTFFVGQPLATVATTFGLSKCDYDIKNLTEAEIYNCDFVDYAKNDAFITGEIVRRLRYTEYKSSGVDILLTKTPANTASAEFRRAYLKRAIKQEWVGLRRRVLYATWGGRKECFYRGEKSLVYEYDAKSFYPNIVRLLQVLPLEQDWHSTCDMTEWLEAKGGIGEVIFSFPPTTHKPCLPVLIEIPGPDDDIDHDKVCFPLEGISHCTTFEVQEAKNLGATLQLVKGFYYTGGVDWLARYMTSLVNKREASQDSVEKELLKSKAVAVIGKLTQKREVYDINDLYDYEKLTGVPTDISAGVLGLPIKTEVLTGSLFYPEWYAVILGKARANIAKVAIDMDALQIATDAVFTETYKGTEFVYGGIVYRLEAVGDYVAYRQGLYRSAETLHYHGTTREIGERVLQAFLKDTSDITYSRTRITSIREHTRSRLKLGQVRQLPDQHLALGYDGKRILLANGETTPLKGRA